MTHNGNRSISVEEKSKVNGPGRNQIEIGMFRLIINQLFQTRQNGNLYDTQGLNKQTYNRLFLRKTCHLRIEKRTILAENLIIITKILIGPYKVDSVTRIVLQLICLKYWNTAFEVLRATGTTTERSKKRARKKFQHTLVRKRPISILFFCNPQGTVSRCFLRRTENVEYN